MSDEIELVPDLYRLAYMPGCFKCPTCGFVLSKATLSVASGQIGTTESNRESEPCPNDGTMMIHVTYREQVEEYHARLREEFDRVDKLESELAVLRVAPSRDLQDFARLVRQMRDAQRLYFKTRTREALIDSKDLERLVDGSLKHFVEDSRAVKSDS